MPRRKSLKRLGFEAAEEAVQLSKYDALLKEIHEEKGRGRDVILCGGRRIALLIFKSEKKYRLVSNRTGIPIYRENGQLRLSNWAYEVYQTLRDEGAALDIPFKALVLQRQPFDPKKKAADLEAYARAARQAGDSDAVREKIAGHAQSPASAPNGKEPRGRRSVVQHGETSHSSV